MKRVSFILIGMLLGTIVLRGAVINVAPGSGTIKTAISNASAGDVLVLSTGEYNETSTITTSVALTIRAEFTLEGVTFFGSTHLLRVTATDPIDFNVRNCIFHMGTEAANTNRTIYIDAAPTRVKNVRIADCTFDGGINGTGRFIYVYPGEHLESLEGSVEIDHCTFYNSNDSRGVYPANIDGAHVTNCGSELTVLPSMVRTRTYITALSSMRQSK